MAANLMESKQKVTLIKGDGIGVEIADSMIEIFAKAQIPIQWIEMKAGLEVIEKTGKGIQDQDLKNLAENKIAIKGPTATPVGSGHKSINVTIRKALDLFANVRPIKTLPCLKTPFANVDLIIVRENIEDTYGGIEHQQSPDLAQCLRLVTRSGCERIHRYAFEMARREKRKKVTCIHKANIMKLTDGLFLDVFREVAKEFPEIEALDMIVDNCCMQLVTKPEQFDVLVLPNLFGDIVSDLCAGLVGGLGIASGANIGKNAAVFEAVHGSAPDIAGKGLANPTAFLFSSILMVKHLGLLDKAAVIERALMLALNDEKSRTRDLKGSGNTRTFTDAILRNI
jgi:isocitrate dehydrogenase (NAD+)